MVSGLFLGGLSQGFQNQEKISNQADFQQKSLLQVQQQEVQNQQQRDQNANFMKIRSDAVSHLDETINQLKIAHPDWGPLQLAANPAITAMKQQIGTLDQNLKLPNTIDSQVASMIERPSEAVTERKLAEARDPYKSQIEQLTIQEKQQELKAAKQNSDLAGATTPSSTSPTNPSNELDPNDPGDKFLARIPSDSARQQIKDLAEYRINPQTFSTRIPKGATQSQRQIMTGLAEQYAAAKGEDYDQTQFTARNKAVTNFSGGPEARAIKSFNVLVDHLDVLKSATTALGNGDVQAFNSIKNTISSATGSPAPTDFNGVKSIVADELVIRRFLVAGLVALGDREKIDAAVRDANSPSNSTASFSGINLWPPDSLVVLGRNTNRQPDVRTLTDS